MQGALAGKKAVIVGGAGRIGKSVARAFLAEDAEVLLVDKNERAVAEVKESLRGEAYHRCQVAPLLVDSAEKAHELAELTHSRLGCVDVLVNCPGHIYRASFLDHPVEELDSLWNHNVRVVFLACQAIGRLMAARRSGKIINFSSVGGTRPEAQHSGYCAAKSALIALSKVIALELAEYNVQVNVVAPGPTETVPFTSSYYLEHPEILRRIEQRTPLGRIGHPEDHVGLVVFLASDKSNWITGQVVLSDGGLSLT